MKKLIYILYFLFISFVACKNCRKGDGCKLETINLSEIYNLKKETRYLSKFTSKFEYIQPETESGCYFKMMGISYISKDLVILYNKSSKQLYAFKNDGKLIGKIGNVGRGPGEYIYFRKVFVFPELKEIHVYCPIQKQILRFNFDLEQLGEIYIDFQPSAIEVYQNRYYLCAYDDLKLKENGGNDLVVRDPVSFNELKVLWKRKTDKSHDSSEKKNYSPLCKLFKNRDTIFYAREINEEKYIYRISQNGVKPVFLLKGKLSGENLHFINNLMFFNDYLLIGIQKSNNIYEGYYNLRTKAIRTFDIVNDLDKGVDFYPMGETMDGGYFSDDIKLCSFTKTWKENKTSNVKCKFPDREKWLKENVLKSPEANPLIMVIYP